MGLLQNMQNQNMNLVLSTDAKPGLKWTAELHQRFVEAVNQLGGADKVTLKSLMRVTGIHGLTLYHLKSHLQAFFSLFLKYRLGKSHQSENCTDIKKEDDHEPNYGLDQNNPQPNDYGNEEEPDYHQNTHEPTNYGYEEDNDGCEEDNDYDEDNHESNYGFDCQNSVNGYVEPLKGSNSFDNEVVQPSHGYAANTATNKPLANQEVDAHVVFTQASKLYNNPHLH
ncbi:unnamed protein product [Prunus armeniaca]